MIALYIYRQRQGKATLQMSTVAGVRRVSRSVKYYFRHLPFVLRCVAVALLIVALARPQGVSSDTNSTTEGIDIVLAIDVSSSMLAQDFRPDRISAAKETAAKFIMDRPNDRIGRLRRREFYPESVDYRQGVVGQHFGYDPQRNHRRRYGDRKRFGNGNQPVAGEPSQKQSDHPVDRWCEQQRPDCSADGGGYCQNTWNPGLHDRRGK